MLRARAHPTLHDMRAHEPAHRERQQTPAARATTARPSPPASEPANLRAAAPRPIPEAADALAGTLARAVQEREVAMLQRWPWSKKKAAGPVIKHHTKVVMGNDQPVGAMVQYRGTSVKIQSSPQDPTFLLKVASMLERIEAILGPGLIDGIDNSGERVTIFRGALNYCRGGGTAGSTELRKAHADYDNATFADQLDSAMQDAGIDVDDLARAVAAQKLPHWDNTRSASPFGSANAARPLLQSWLDGTAIPDQDEDGHELVDVLSIVLADHLDHGSGVSSAISFDADLTNAGGGAGIRPPEVGLAHELTHAYYHARGMQLGTEDSSEEIRGGRLFELQAVGLKPFHNMPYSENQMRAGLGGLPLRTNYP